ncbi:hypothetical protein Q5741_20970 [Paenibacillus sp. JX-17]|uniref:Uncharacterized protein n=1 Tax=Paenibacillus lacisoli TaxID=3064525 RepID=A0ABT9CJ00_9BACL|nr:hypothetical protein [Paenibacillus sp. JX-17]MDO7908860.1 hypothetical protein [Paenibacillus sp. JX-17]
MKKYVIPAALSSMIAVSLLASPTHADALTNSEADSSYPISQNQTNSLITPMEDNGDVFSDYVTIDGVKNQSFYYTGKASPEKVRIYLNNPSKKTIRYTLYSPKDVIWMNNRTLAPGESATTEITLNSTHGGSWRFNFSTSDGSTAKIWLSVRDHLPL